MKNHCEKPFSTNYLFNDFQVGDVVIFNRTFFADEFKAFQELSGDYNPLHCDLEYAETTRFNKPIVPLHMTLAPLSFIAGMIFPGKPSLYLGHEVRASQPVYYEEKITYSARIESINRAHRIMTIRVLAIRATEIVLDALMRVQSLQEEWQSPPPRAAVIKSGTPAYALITGSSGEIGTAIALALAGEGWKLILQDRGPDSRREKLGKALDQLGSTCEFIAADLCCKEGRQILANAIKDKRETFGLVVHTASAGVQSSLDELVATNYGALRSLTEAALPGFLSRQDGIILFVSTIYVTRPVIGWEDYTAAKTMATGFVSGIDRRFSTFGVRGLSILPGVVATRFSAPFRGDAPALLPEEVAVEVLKMIQQRGASVVTLEVGSKKEGVFGIHIDSETFSRVSDNFSSANSRNENGDRAFLLENADMAVREKLTGLIKRILRVPAAEDVSKGGLGITPGWDSLSQIEIIIAVESEFGISFSSSDISEITQYSLLEKVVLRKLG